MLWCITGQIWREMFIHDLWLVFLWASLQRGVLCWDNIRFGFIFISYWQPYHPVELIAELLLLDIWMSHQRFWALEAPIVRWIKSGMGLLALLIVQQRFSLYDKQVLLTLWGIFFAAALYQILIRSYHSGYALRGH